MTVYGTVRTRSGRDGATDARPTLDCDYIIHADDRGRLKRQILKNSFLASLLAVPLIGTGGYFLV